MHALEKDVKAKRADSLTLEATTELEMWKKELAELKPVLAKHTASREMPPA